MTSDNDYTASGLTEAELDAQLEQEGAELERQLIAYTKKMDVRFGVTRSMLIISLNKWFEESVPLRIQWIANGNSLSGTSIYDVGAVCLQAAPRTLLFKNSTEGTCPTLVDGKVEWK